MMEFVKRTELEVYKSWKKVWKWIFRCSYCWNEKEISVSNAKKVSSCWCMTKELFYKNKIEKFEKNTTVIDMWYYIEFSLTNWWFCKLDKSDYDMVKWSSWYKSIRWYVETRKNNKLVKLHRLVMWMNKWKVIDHINRDKLDNRKENLRYCTQSDNMKNIWPIKWKYKWVHKNKQWKYVAQCQHKHIWTFENEEEAWIAYNKKAKELFGDFAFLNIIK